MAKIADLFAQEIIQFQVFREIGGLIERAKNPEITLSAAEAKKLNFVEAVTEQSLGPAAILAAWQAFERLQVPPSDPSKKL
jgi:hypothetical protein